MPLKILETTHPSAVSKSHD